MKGITTTFEAAIFVVARKLNVSFVVAEFLSTPTDVSEIGVCWIFTGIGIAFCWMTPLLLLINENVTVPPWKLLAAIMVTVAVHTVGYGLMPGLATLAESPVPEACTATLSIPVPLKDTGKVPLFPADSETVPIGGAMFRLPMVAVAAEVVVVAGVTVTRICWLLRTALLLLVKSSVIVPPVYPLAGVTEIAAVDVPEDCPIIFMLAERPVVACRVAPATPVPPKETLNVPIFPAGIGTVAGAVIVIGTVGEETTALTLQTGI